MLRMQKRMEDSSSDAVKLTRWMTLSRTKGNWRAEDVKKARASGLNVKRCLALRMHVEAPQSVGQKDFERIFGHGHFVVEECAEPSCSGRLMN
jgi:hypothetical protein